MSDNEKFIALCNAQAAAIQAYEAHPCGMTLDNMRKADFAVQVARLEVEKTAET